VKTLIERIRITWDVWKGSPDLANGKIGIICLQKLTQEQVDEIGEYINGNRYMAHYPKTKKKVVGVAGKAGFME